MGQKDEACEQGVARLATSAALIKAILEGNPFNASSGELVSPQLRFTAAGEIEAWVKRPNAVDPEDMFDAWPNKFAKLAFGFACDHFKMLHEHSWHKLMQKAAEEGDSCAVDAKSIKVSQESMFSISQPERMTAPALAMMCQKINGAPSWLLWALSDLEHGCGKAVLTGGGIKTKGPK